MIGLRFSPLKSTDVRGAGTRDELLRASEWEAILRVGISIMNSKSGFHGFPFYRSIGKSEKRICKIVLVNSGLLFVNYGCTCKTAVLKDSFSNPFADFPIER